MTEPSYTARSFAPRSDVSGAARHSAVVRITHWVNVVSFAGLVVSGIAILISHPRLYWGETGNWETPSLLDLPLPFVLEGQNGWARYLHFLAAWAGVGNGVFYLLSGVIARHFRKNLLPRRGDLDWNSISKTLVSELRFRRGAGRESQTYNILQRVAYLVVVFLLFPAAIWTGLAMSPAITSVVPVIVNVAGGHQSARTIHFVVASALVLFLLVHITMVVRAGFGSRMRAMITGHHARGKESP